MPGEHSGPDAGAGNRNSADEERPLHAGTGRYPDEVARQAELVAAEHANIARAAGAVGATVGEWQAIRRELAMSDLPMRDVTEGDVVAYRARQSSNQDQRR
jgi:hypothetical protein